VGDYMAGIFGAMIDSEYFGGKKGASTGHIMANRNFNCFLAMIFIMLPLSLLRKISLLSFTSYASMVGICFSMFAVFYRFCEKAPTIPRRRDHEVTLFQSGDKFMDIFLAFPILFFAFGSHFTLLPIYYEIKNRSQKNMGHAINVSSIICLVCYLCIGIFGYVQFGNSGTRENILNSFQSDDLLILLSKICMLFVVALSYPLINFAARVSVETLIFPNKPFSWLRWILIACIMAGIIVLTVLIPVDIVTIFGLTGATFGMILMFILPCVFYAVVEKQRGKRVFAIVVAVICFVLGLISTASVIMDFVQKKMGSKSMK